MFAHYFGIRPWEIDLLEVVHFLRYVAEAEEIRAENARAAAAATEQESSRRGGRYE